MAGAAAEHITKEHTVRVVPIEQPTGPMFSTAIEEGVREGVDDLDDVVDEPIRRRRGRLTIARRYHPARLAREHLAGPLLENIHLHLCRELLLVLLVSLRLLAS